MEWLSDSDVFTSFKEQGQQTTDNTSSITVSPLTPSTKYEFTVATVTPDGQLGEPVPLEVTTSKEVGGKNLLFTGIQPLCIILSELPGLWVYL